MADRPPSPEDEDDAFWRSQVILDADDEKAGADLYPRLFNISTGMIYTAVLRTQDPEPAEYVTIPLSSGWGDEENRLHVAVTRWNMQWEAAQFRRWIFREDDLPSPLSELAGRVISTSCWCRVPARVTSSTRPCSTCCPERYSNGMASRCCTLASGRPSRTSIR